ncbi:hypothetical protein B0H13DRAFT_1875279 [Mycena leptocephala]|nr:hypothetical protein B0H13DRAFT_1875279 [Mycena leptocephala]
MPLTTISKAFIRTRIRERPLKTHPVDFITYRDAVDGDHLDDESDDRANVPQTAIPMLAVIPTFDENNANLAYPAILPDPFIQIFFRIQLGSGVTSQMPPANLIVAEELYGRPVHRVHTGYHKHLMETITAESRFIHCAANDHNPHIEGTPPPLSIPIEALWEINTPMPGISLACSYPLPTTEDELDSRVFTSPDAAAQYVVDLQKVAVYFLHFILDTAQESLTNGINSEWNFAAPINLSKTEYHRRLAPGEVANLITCRVKRLLILNDEGCITCITSTIWPMAQHLEYEDDGDRVMREFLMENGVDEEELDSAVIDKGDGSGVWQEADW